MHLLSGVGFWQKANIRLSAPFNPLECSGASWQDERTHGMHWTAPSVCLGSSSSLHRRDRLRANGAFSLHVGETRPKVPDEAAKCSQMWADLCAADKTTGPLGLVGDLRFSRGTVSGMGFSATQPSSACRFGHPLALPEGRARSAFRSEAVPVQSRTRRLHMTPS